MQYLGAVEYGDNAKLDEIMASEGITTYDTDDIWQDALNGIYGAAYLVPNSYPEVKVNVDRYRYIIVWFKAGANGEVVL